MLEKMLLKRFCFTLVFFICFTFAFAQDRDIPRTGEGIHAFLHRNNRDGNVYYEEFLKINKGKFGKNNSLLKGITYRLPPLSSTSVPKPDLNPEKLPPSGNCMQPLFGKRYENYTVKDRVLEGANFFLVSGHGGPDCGAIAEVDGHELHEDEYAYDIVLRLARNLLEHGATVHLIIQDPRDGIRDGKYLNNSKNETCMGAEIPLNQKKRLQQRADKINQLSARTKGKYQRAIFVHLDSRSKKKQLDVFFYYQDKVSNQRKSQQLANTMRKTFDNMYEKHQPGRGFSGTVTTRPLAVLKNTNPVSIFVELANMQNVNDQKRYVFDENRQALANWLCLGFIKDYQASK
jgi:N-acetylmuramoyl-L-alanine amidase